MINSSKYQSVTYSQIDKMKHTIGFSNKKVTGIKHRKYEPYRNYYCAGECDIEELNNLCTIGLMENWNNNYYSVTKDGKEFLMFVTGVEILEDLK